MEIEEIGRDDFQCLLFNKLLTLNLLKFRHLKRKMKTWKKNTP